MHNESNFQIPRAAIKNCQEFISFLEKQDYLRAVDIQFFQSLMELAQSEAERQENQHLATLTIRLSELQAYLKEASQPSNKTTILNKAKRFVEYGFFRQNTLHRPNGGQPALAFNLTSIHRPNQKSKIEKALEERVEGRVITRKSQKNSKQIIRYLEESDAQFLKSLKETNAKTENLYTGILDRAMRFTTREEIVGKHISINMVHNGTKLLVSSTTTTHPSAEIAVLADQRVIRAIVSKIVDFIEDEVDRVRMEIEMESAAHNAPVTINPETGSVEVTQREISESDLDEIIRARVKNQWFFDVVELAEKMGYAQPRSGSTRALINRALQRLHDTQFRVVIRDADPAKTEALMHKFGLPDSKMSFRFISDLKSQYEHEFGRRNNETGTQIAMDGMFDRELEERLSDEEAADPYNINELKRVRFWRISLDGYLFDRLLSKKSRAIFAAHDEILRESSGVAQTLYNFCSHRIGRTNTDILKVEERRYTNKLRALHNELWATRPYPVFEKSFLELMRRHTQSSEKAFNAKDQVNTARMFGYIFKLTRNQADKSYWIHISRDRQDPLNGDKSTHNRLLKKHNNESQKT